MFTLEMTHFKIRFVEKKYSSFHTRTLHVYSTLYVLVSSVLLSVLRTPTSSQVPTTDLRTQSYKIMTPWGEV